MMDCWATERVRGPVAGEGELPFQLPNRGRQVVSVIAGLLLRRLQDELIDVLSTPLVSTRETELTHPYRVDDPREHAARNGDRVIHAIRRVREMVDSTI